MKLSMSAIANVIVGVAIYKLLEALFLGDLMDKITGK